MWRRLKSGLWGHFRVDRRIPVFQITRPMHRMRPLVDVCSKETKINSLNSDQLSIVFRFSCWIKKSLYSPAQNTTNYVIIINTDVVQRCLI